jgi:phosphoglycolate phosphatase
MNFKDKELIIFDLDGTLINSIPDITLAINKMLSQYDAPPLTDVQVEPLVGNGAKLLVKRSLELSMNTQEVPNELFEEAFANYFTAYSNDVCVETFLYPDVLETLSYLHKKGYKMVICSNKPFHFMEPILEKLTIKPFISYWIGEDSLSEKKPSATPLLHVAHEMKISLEKSIMVGDSKNDILAAHNAGIPCIGLTYGYNYNENIADYNPTIVVDRFAELQKLF